MNRDNLEPIPKVTKKPNYNERVRLGLQRGGLRPVSKGKQVWLDKYNKLKDEADEYQICQRCSERFHKESSPPHHPYGRDKEKILIIMWLCHDCHEWVHANPNKAREDKFLFF
jgi:hypothetical protein